MRKGNQVLIITTNPTLYYGLEQALRPFGLQAVTYSDWPVAGLVDFRQQAVHDFEVVCPFVALVDNSLEKRREALLQGCSLAVTEGDTAALAAYLAEAVINLELEPERVLVCRHLQDLNPNLALISQIGWNVCQVRGPQECLEVMETFRPDLLLLDRLPEEDANALCRVLRADPRWQTLVISASIDNVLEEGSALESGVDDVLPHYLCGGKVLQRLADRLQRFRPFRVQERDTLTGCLMRRYAASVLDRLVRLAVRKEKSFSLVLVDIDNFKRLNDTYGHAAGDQVLANIGSILRRSFRQEDVVARWGGEEFLIALFDSNKENAAKRLSHIANLANEAVYEFDSEIRITFSAGVAELGSEGKNLFELIERADQALYRAKELGRNRIELATAAEFLEEIVLVEDDLVLAQFITKLVRRQGLSIRHYSSAEEALTLLSRTPPRLCIIDYCLPGMTGLELLRHFPEGSESKVVMVSGHSSLAEIQQAMQVIGHRFLAKPFGIEKLLDLTEEALTA